MIALTQEKELIDRYNDIKLTLRSYDITVSDYKLINYGLQFKVSVADWMGIIRIYQNKKGVLNTDYSQLKEPNATKIRSLVENEETTSKLTITTKKNGDLYYPMIGTDESGKGDYFGPLVSAGVYVDEHSAKDLMLCGVKDSKKLSDSKNLELAKKITEICYGRYAIIEVSPEKYNNLYEQFKRENKTLNALLAWQHAKAIEEILNYVDCNLAIADQFADESVILSKLQEKGKKLELIQMPKAEQNVAVAAASILARARFLNKLAKLSERYNIELPKGASQNVIEIGTFFVELYGKDELKKVAKLHFKTTDKILAK